MNLSNSCERRPVNNPSSVLRAERLATWKAVFVKSRTRDIFEGIHFAEERVAHKWGPRALGLNPNLVLFQVPFPVQYVCLAVLHHPLGSSSSSIWHRAGQRKSRAGMKAVDFHLPVLLGIQEQCTSFWPTEGFTVQTPAHAPLLCRAQASLNKFSWDYLVVARHCRRVECSHPW